MPAGLNAGRTGPTHQSPGAAETSAVRRSSVHQRGPGRGRLPLRHCPDGQNPPRALSASASPQTLARTCAQSWNSQLSGTARGSSRPTLDVSQSNRQTSNTSSACLTGILPKRLATEQYCQSDGIYVAPRKLERSLPRLFDFARFRIAIPRLAPFLRRPLPGYLHSGREVSSSSRKDP